VICVWTSLAFIDISERQYRELPFNIHRCRRSQQTESDNLAPSGMADVETVFIISVKGAGQRGLKNRGRMAP